MVKPPHMTSLILAAATAVAALCSSCDKKRTLPDNPDAKFNRYTTDLQMSSARLGYPIKFSLFLPEGYNKESERRYPVVYLLHGLGDDHHAWNDQYLRVASVIEAQEAAGLEPMIYVMPQAFKSYYVNRHDGTLNYMDMFVEELVPHIDRTYRTIADRDHRAAVGYSMGGFGAMILPSKHPELFSVSVPLSMSVRTDAQYMTEPASGWDTQWGAIFGGRGQSGAARLTDYYKANCPFYMFNSGSVQDFAGVSYFFDCGDDEEQLLVANDDLHVMMRDLGMAHEYRVRNGAHTSDYWRSATSEVLPYIECRFKGLPYKTEETVALPDSYSAIRESRTFAGVAADVYLPSGYATDPSRSYSALYFLYGGDRLPADNAMKMLSSVQQAKPFIMIAADGTAIADFATFAAAAEADYRLLPGNDRRVALGFEAGGKTLYEASLAATPPFASLFLLDGAIDETIARPNGAVFYHISLADMGLNYRGANALYKYCHVDGVRFEYRVYNGVASAISALVGLNAMRQAISDRIKTN
ncbi:hypothetical protein FACS1894159_09650 [Bacteroidia bacterium]|nr:hypothetical protein FACS1894159_09650 [Bacteroidia bacterium]